VRQNTTMAEVMTQEFYSSNFMKLGMALGENKLEMTGHPSAVFYAWNEEDSTAEVLPAFPVAAGSKVSTEGMEIVDIPAGKVVKAAYYGPYEGGAGAHKKIGEYCKANNIKTGLTIEEYANDPTTVASPDEILTNIYYFIIEE
ncbi:MAG: GyrI-like domain-containing protein, partial [Flavobacteriales bacterium]